MHKAFCCQTCADCHLQEQILQEYAAAITKRLPFTLHLLRGRPNSLQTRQLIIAHFKPAATDSMNSGAPLVGIPGQVGWQEGQGGLLYFVTVQKDELPDARLVLLVVILLDCVSWYLTAI